MNLPRTCADIPNRESSLVSDEAQALLDSLPFNIRELIVNHYLTSSSSNLQELLDYFVKNSAIFKLIHQVPGSALGFEYLYTHGVSTPIDQYLVDCKAGSQIFQRLLSLEANLPSWLNRLLDSKHDILVDNIGCGTGRDMIGVLGKNPHLAKTVKVRHIDPDIESLAISEKLAQDSGVADSFSFHGSKLSHVPPAEADMALLVGILCSFPRRVSKTVLRSVIPYVRRGGGMVIYSSVLRKMVIEDLLTDFLMRLSGWHMSYKSEKESEDLAKSLGWRVIGKFFDEPLHYHCMVVAETT